MVDHKVALERKCDTFVESSVVDLPFVGQVGAGYEGKHHPVMISSNVPS